MATRKPIYIPHRIPPALFLICFFLLSLSGGACAAIYKWVDADGRVQFSDQPPPGGGVEKVQLREINTFEGVEVEEVRTETPHDPRREKAKKVVMYSASWCGVCTRARRFFQAEKIPFRELDIEKSAKAKREYKRMNAKGVPVILVGGKRMNGFSEQRFMALYQN